MALLDLGASKCSLNNSAVLRTQKYKERFKTTTGKDFVEEEGKEDYSSEEAAAARNEEQCCLAWFG